MKRTKRTMNNSQLNSAIMSKLKEIRALLEENGGVQYLSMAIMSDGGIMYHNSFDWDAVASKNMNLEGYEK